MYTTILTTFGSILGDGVKAAASGIFLDANGFGSVVFSGFRTVVFTSFFTGVNAKSLSSNSERLHTGGGGGCWTS